MMDDPSSSNKTIMSQYDDARGRGSNSPYSVHSCNAQSSKNLTSNQVALLSNHDKILQTVICSEFKDCTLDLDRPVATITKNNCTLIPEGVKFDEVRISGPNKYNYDDCNRIAK